MVAVESTMMPLGSPAPPFTLEDPEGNKVSLEDVAREKRATLVMFICNHCPYVVHVRDKLAELTKEYQAMGVGVVAINANDAEAYPQDALPAMGEEARRMNYTFPYLFDADQSVAKAYKAACTPDFFLFDGALQLVYRGQFDASRPRSGTPATGEDLTAAVEAVVAGSEVPKDQTPSMGCNIKWRPGNEPDYFG